MQVCNTKLKQKDHQFIFTLLILFTTYTAVIFTYFYHTISILSSSIQGLCYQMLICCSIWNFCVQTAIHLQQYKPTLFFAPQYLEGLSNQTQNGMLSQIQQKYIPYNIKTARIIISIRHELGCERPVSASTNNPFKSLRLLWSLIQHYFWHPVVPSCYMS